MASEFESCVDYGLTLSKRLYYGKEPGSGGVVVPPGMTRQKPESYLPEAVMVYAVVRDPQIVDNPDVPSYQPYVHGNCQPPALIPLHMHGVEMEVDCCLDTAFVAFNGTWRVHCIMASRNCDCRIAVPLREQGSLLGVEVEIDGRLYQSNLITIDDAGYKENVGKSKGDGCYLKGQIYTFRIPQVDGGSTLSIKVNWSQKLTYEEGQFCLNVPFSFPAYVIPAGKKIPKREKIKLNVKSAISQEIVCKCTTHPIKELSRELGKLSFLYEGEVKRWSKSEFKVSYTVSSNDLLGGVILQSPSLHDFDQRQMFCLYLFPGKSQSRKIFRKDVVFLVDVSGSMEGYLLEQTKNALRASLSKLNPRDSFNIIAFNGETCLFSSSMELASQGAITKATQWLTNLVAGGGTNILLPLKQAIKLLSDTSESIPLIFLITDGAVGDERGICNQMKSYLTSTRSISHAIFRKISLMENPELGSASVLNEWEKGGRKLTKWELCRVVKELRKFRRYRHALEVYEWMNNRGERFRLSASDAAILLDLISKVRGVASAEDFFLSLPGTLKDRRVYGALLNAYVRARMRGNAELLIDKMRDKGYAVHSLPFNVMMTLYMNLKEYDKVDLVVSEMKEKGIRLDVYTYNIWLSSCGSQGSTEKMEEVFEQMKVDKAVNPNWTTFSTMATMYIKMGQIEKAEECLRRVESRITGRDRIPYHYLLSLYGGVGMKEEVYRVWNLYKSIFPSITNLGYHAMISSLARVGDVEGMGKIHEEWLSVKSSYDPRITNLMMSCYIKEGNFGKAEALFNNMVEEGGKPNSTSWETLAEGHIGEVRIPEALYCFKEAFAAEGARSWRPKPVNVTSFFKLCEEESDMGSKEALVALLRQPGYRKERDYMSLIGLTDEDGAENNNEKEEDNDDDSEMLLSQLQFAD